MTIRSIHFCGVSISGLNFAGSLGTGGETGGRFQQSGVTGLDIGCNVCIRVAGRPGNAAEKDFLESGFVQTSSRWPIDV